MNNKELNAILDKHDEWLKTRFMNETKGERANLNGADLCGFDLSFINLRGADMCGVKLRNVNLRGADLYGANLYGADLSYANLYGANMCGANLCGANLCGADLCGSDLCYADYNDSTSFYALICPEKGIFTGWKKAYGYIIELEIPADAKRSSATTRKCRCSKAKVISITEKNGNKCDLKTVRSDRVASFVYTVGEVVEVDNFDEDRWKECAPGIHFFITREEAVKY